MFCFFFVQFTKALTTCYTLDYNLVRDESNELFSNEESSLNEYHDKNLNNNNNNHKNIQHLNNEQDFLLLKKLLHERSKGENFPESERADKGQGKLKKRSDYYKLRELEFCKNVNCDNVHSNGQLSKTWRIAQLTTCCPAYRKIYFSHFKKNVVL